MRRARACGGAASALFALLGASHVAHADVREERDGSYGRFEGDLGVAGAAAMTVGPRGARAGADVRLRYLSTAGIFGSFEDGSLVGSGSEPRRALAFGVELRPLFLARWATGLEIGSPRLDLLVDSLGLELGTVFMQPDGARFGGRAGFQLGLGVELPFFASATGPFLGIHGGARWSDAALSGGPLDGPSDRALFLTFSVGWQQLFGGRLVDFGDRRPVAAAKRMGP